MKSFGYKSWSKCFVALLAATALLFACTPGEIGLEGTNTDNNNPDPASEVVNDPVSSVTVGAEHVSAVSAVLKGRAIVKTDPESVVYGFQYYKISGSSTASVETLVSTNKDELFSYTVVLAGLEPNTTYKYWSFVRSNGRDTFGNPGEFTTKGVESLLETKEASDIKATGATLNAMADLTDVGYAYKSISYGFCWGYSASIVDRKISAGNIKDNAYSALLTGRAGSTTFWFKAYVELDGKSYFGDVKSFTTDVLVDKVKLNKGMLVLEEGTDFKLDVTVTPDNAADKSVTWTALNESVATVDQTGKVTAKSIGSTYINVKANDGSGYETTCAILVCRINGDLGLSVKWATSNLCSTGLCANPWDYGDNYAWGETEPKSSFSWGNYKLCNGTQNTLTKYCTDNKTVLEAEDDAAHEKLGDGWHIPTWEQWEELRVRCARRKLADLNGTGTHGDLMTASNGNSIFLPSTYTTSDGFSIVGYYGSYWTSTLDKIYNYKYRAGYMSLSDSDVYIYSIDRCYGKTIRPVYSATGD